jgi:E3 ubiquitin-protein ligase SHPRH
MAADAECQCPICRRAIRTNELVVLQPRDDGDEDRIKISGTGDSASKTLQDKEAPGAAAAVAGSVGSSTPGLTLAADDADFQAIPLPRGPLLPLLPQFPAVPSRFLTHLSEAAGVSPGSPPNVAPRPSGRSSKMLQLLADLDRVLYKTVNTVATGSPRDAGDAGGSLRGKAVVFSQHKSVIQHASYLLKATGVRHVSICPGDNQQTLRDAVATFNSEQSCGVFLLHAGTAAAGLTLTAARHVFLLEPFLSAAEEAQAMNRAHRIGQKYRTEPFCSHLEAQDLL